MGRNGCAFFYCRAAAFKLVALEWGLGEGRGLRSSGGIPMGAAGEQVQMTTVVVRGVSKLFRSAGERRLPGAGRDVAALQGVDLEVRSGERLVILGRSGSGKTTLLRVIAGLEPVSAGEVWIDGVAMERVPPAARNVALVFQQASLYPHLNVAENVAFGLKLGGYSAGAIDQRVAEVARVFGLETILSRRPAELSGGQQQRVALARAVARRPRLLLLDEPLAQLDPVARTALRIELNQYYRQTGATMIHVTHDQSEALALADRVAFLASGRVYQVATPTELFARPAHVEVARCVGHPPLNLVAGTVRQGLFQAHVGAAPLPALGCASAVSDAAGSEEGVWLGVAAHDLVVARDGATAEHAGDDVVGPAWSAHVRHVERADWQETSWLVHVEVVGATEAGCSPVEPLALTICTPERLSATIGDRVQVRFRRAARWHWFAAAGERLREPDSVPLPSPNL
jgi:ABC-type sugar transport system ATPase subunit